MEGTYLSLPKTGCVIPTLQTMEEKFGLHQLMCCYKVKLICCIIGTSWHILAQCSGFHKSTNSYCVIIWFVHQENVHRITKFTWAVTSYIFKGSVVIVGWWEKLKSVMFERFVLGLPVVTLILSRSSNTGVGFEHTAFGSCLCVYMYSLLWIYGF